MVERVSINFKKNICTDGAINKHLKDLDEKGYLKTLDENTLGYAGSFAWSNHGSHKLKPSIRLIRLSHSLSTGIPGQD